MKILKELFLSNILVLARKNPIYYELTKQINKQNGFLNNRLLLFTAIIIHFVCNEVVFDINVWQNCKTSYTISVHWGTGRFLPV